MIQRNLELNILEEQVTPIFARHETFHPRWGWLKKGFEAVSQDSNIFLAEDATVKLGVGKNMVRSLRYWCSAFKIIDENNNPSEFGNNLLGDSGWDRYLENPASLWLLHWNLLKPTCNAASWYYTFNLFNENEFNKEDLYQGLYSYQNELGKNIAESSLRKDISCVLRMYVESDQEDINFIEDSIDCPFVELGLIYQPSNSNYYRFRVGKKSNLPAEIIVATCLEYASWVSDEETTISIARLLYDLHSPGVLFKLSEEALYEAIEIICRRYQNLHLADTAGLIQLSFPKNPLELANKIINDYYHN
jgi:hypothetical protein